MNKCSKILEFHLSADDTNLFLSDNNVQSLEFKLNIELETVSHWLSANKLSLNIKKTSFVVFHCPQKKILHQVNLQISNKQLKQVNQVKYLGLISDSNLNWKSHIHVPGIKISRGIGILAKIRHLVNSNMLSQLYYSLVFPGLLVWGNTYQTTLKPIVSLQKRAIRIMTFSKPDEHSGPLFKQLEILKQKYLVYFYNALFMYKFHNNLLPRAYQFFQLIPSVHKYNTRLASRSLYYIKNYGKFNIHFAAATIWNNLDDNIKDLSQKSFKTNIKLSIFQSYIIIQCGIDSCKYIIKNKKVKKISNKDMF